MGHFSGCAGAVALTVIVIPVVVRTTENMLLLVPNGLREAAAALGAPRMVRDHAGDLASGARPASSPACCWRSRASPARPRRCCSPRSTTSSGRTDLNEPMASLPVVIFQYRAVSPYDDWHDLAWAGALLITATVLTLSIIARLARTQETELTWTPPSTAPTHATPSPRSTRPRSISRICQLLLRHQPRR